MPWEEGREGEAKLQRERRRDPGETTLTPDHIDVTRRSSTFDDRGNRIVPDEDEAEGEGRKARTYICTPKSA